MDNMTEKNTIEKAVLVGLSTNIFKAEENSDWDTLDELEALLETAGGECVGKVLQTRPSPDAKTFIGEGKAEEVRDLAKNNDAKMVIFDNELSPSQMRVLEEFTGCTILDRSGLILDIFAQRARTNEGKLQVELAQYKYILPRLSGLGKSMSRLGGGIGTRGPGESKLESDRRHIRRRIDKLSKDLEDVKKVRTVQRRQRKKTEMPLVSIVGYTNAGKSTLLNTLTNAGIEANNRLFDTLDPTTRKFKVSDTKEILLSDTVGFIRKLPHHLVEAFKATLEELSYADLLLHVVDVSSENFEIQAQTVEKVINQLGASEIPTIMVYNKADVCESLDIIKQNNAVTISAKRGRGIQELLSLIEKELDKGKKEVCVLIPYSEGYIIDELHKKTEIISVEYKDNGTEIRLVCDEKVYGQIREYIFDGEK